MAGAIRHSSLDIFCQRWAKSASPAAAEPSAFAAADCDPATLGSASGWKELTEAWLPEGAGDADPLLLPA